MHTVLAQASESKIELFWVTVPTAALVAALTTFTCLVINAVIARRQEQRSHRSWQLQNAHDFYYRQYLEDRIKDVRDRIKASNQPDSDDHQRLSRALQRVGIAVFYKFIPDQYVFAMNAVQIVSDWVLLRDYMDSFRKAAKSADGHSASIQDIIFYRRHAEWLALKARMWIEEKDDARFLVDTDRDMLCKFDEMYEGIENVQKKLAKYRRES